MTEDGSGNKTDFTYGNDLISASNKGIISYYINDEKGSVEGIADSNGNIKSSITYDEFGNIENPENVNTNGNIFGFTGYVYDENGLNYANARYYDPQQGRFISEDSVEGDINEPGSLNLYVYCENEPIMGIDPSRHDLWKLSTLVKQAKGSIKYSGNKAIIKLNGKTKQYALKDLACYKGQVIVDDRLLRYDFGTLHLNSKKNDVRSLNTKNKKNIGKITAPYIAEYVQTLDKKWGDVGRAFAVQHINDLAKLSKAKGNIGNRQAYNIGIESDGAQLLMLQAKTNSVGMLYADAESAYEEQRLAGSDMAALYYENEFSKTNGIAEAEQFYVNVGGKKYYVNGSKEPYEGESNALKTQELLQEFANKADKAVDGEGTVPGTLKHTQFGKQIKALNDPLLQSEVTYKNGEIVPYGTKGGVRLDVVEYNSDGTIKSVYDLKTGKAGLTQSRIKQIQNNLPNNAPVIEIRPQK